MRAPTVDEAGSEACLLDGAVGHKLDVELVVRRLDGLRGLVAAVLADEG